MIDVLVGPGKSPATYQPTPRQIAKVLLTIGVPFEKSYLNRTISTLDSLLIVDCSKNIKKQEIGTHHDKKEEHPEFKNLDTHVWLFPVKVQRVSTSTPN